MNDWLVEQKPILIAQHQAETATTGEATTAVPAEEGRQTILSPEFWLFLSPVVAVLIIVIVAVAGTRRLRMIPRGMQNFVEFLVESLNGIPEMVMGPRGRQYAPFISTFFLYIVIVNLTGLIPPFKSGTSSLSITVGLGVTAFLAVQYFGFQAQGIRYLAHFIGPIPLLAWLIVPLELIAELIRPVSLSFRLYGNIFGEERVIEELATKFGPLTAVLMLPLQVMTSVLQALVFTLLVTVYISLATEKHGAHEEPEEAPAH